MAYTTLSIASCGKNWRCLWWTVIIVFECSHNKCLNCFLIIQVKIQLTVLCVFSDSERSYATAVGYICKWNVILTVTSVMQCQTSASMANCPHLICQSIQYSISWSVAYLNTTLENRSRSSRASCCHTLKILDLRWRYCFITYELKYFCSKRFVQSSIFTC